MALLKKILFSCIMLIVALGASSQVVEPVKWFFSQTNQN